MNTVNAELLNQYDIDVYNPMTLKRLFDEDPKGDTWKTYFKKFFFGHDAKIFYFNTLENSFDLYTRDTIKELIPSDCTYKTKEIDQNGQVEQVTISPRNYISTAEFMSENFGVTIDFSKERVFSKKVIVNGNAHFQPTLNMFKSLPDHIDVQIDRNAIKNIDKYTKGVEMIKKHILDVICSGNNEQYQYVMKFIAATLIGRKLRKALYWQSPERTGKGTITNFLGEILGDRIYRTARLENVETYTKGFEGKSLIVLDEVPATNKMTFADIMKNYITEPTFDCRKMHCSSYIQVNTFNFIMTTNNDAILFTQQNKSKYICCDISTSKIGQHKYFETLHTYTKNKIVQKLFYDDMVALTKTSEFKNWNEDLMPFSKTYREKINEAMPKPLRFIKEYFLLKGEGLNNSPDELVNRYKTRTQEKTTTIALGKILSTIGIKQRKVNNEVGCIYEVSHENLVRIFGKNNFLDEWEMEDYAHILNNNTEKEVVQEEEDYSEYNLELSDDIDDFIIDENKKQQKQKNQQLINECENNTINRQIPHSVPSAIAKKILKECNPSVIEEFDDDEEEVIVKKPVNKVNVDPEPESEEEEEEEVIVKKPVKKVVKKPIKKVSESEPVEVFDKKKFAAFLKNI